MSVPLICGSPAAKSEDRPFAEQHREAVARHRAVDAARADVARVSLPFGTKPEGPGASSGIGQLVAGAYPENAPELVKAAKAAPETLHPRVKAHASTLTPNAARLLDLMCKADEAHRGAQLVAAPASDIARSLSIKIEDAEAARAELETRDLIRFTDNFAGDRGFRVRA